MKEKRIVNVDMVYFVNHVKVKLNAKGITFHVFAFSGEKITTIAQAVRAYGWHLQIVRGTESITR